MPSRTPPSTCGSLRFARRAANTTAYFRPSQASAAPVKKEGGQPEEVKTVKVSEIRDGNTFFFHEVDDDAVAAVAEAMEKFKEEHGVAPGPVTFKKGKVRV